MEHCVPLHANMEVCSLSRQLQIIMSLQTQCLSFEALALQQLLSYVNLLLILCQPV